MTQETKPAPVRAKLTVVSVGEKITLQSGVIKLPFVATDDKGSKHDYATFSKGLFDHIKPGVLDVDVVTEEKGNYINRTVKMVYVDGKPISTGKSNWQSYDNPERQASIETQCAVKGVIDLWIAGKIPENHPLVPRALLWLSSKLPNAPMQKPTPDTAKPEAKSPAETSQAEKEFDAIPSATDPTDRESFIAWLQARQISGQMIKNKMGMAWTECIANVPDAVTKIKKAFALKE